ncbi:hypothetical protein B0H11DRAFT_2051907 [Mycena galericulata]|nr:hypothetical protein B0H11DRAFT_2051907 [Mycena galericulata]
MFSLLPASTRILPSLPRNRRFIPTLGRRSSSHRGKAGHLSSRCPDPVRCRLCGGEGHVSRLCTTPDPTHVRPKSWWALFTRFVQNSNIQRYSRIILLFALLESAGSVSPLAVNDVCGETGHLVANCPNPVKCHLCGGNGHIATKCTDPNVVPLTWYYDNVGGETGHIGSRCPNPVKCRRCGGDGHIAAECPDPNVGRPWSHVEVDASTSKISYKRLKTRE